MSAILNQVSYFVLPDTGRVNKELTPNLTRLNVEVTARCNLNCETCVRAVWQESPGDMELTTYKRLIPTFHEIDSVNLSGIGEPLLNKNILEMIHLAKNHLPREGTVTFTTNATLIDKEKAQGLSASGLDTIVVSVDGATGETFNEIRRGAKFDDVLESIRQLVLAREELQSQSPEIGLEFVAQKKNIAELPSLVELAAELGASFVLVSHVLPHSEEMNKQILYELNSDHALEIFQGVITEARSRNLPLLLYPEFVPYIYSLFGLPPLRGMFLPAPMGGNLPAEKGQLFKVLEKAATTAIERNTVLNFTKLMPPDGIGLDHTAEMFRQAQVKAQHYGIALDLPPLIPKTRRDCGFIKNGVCFVTWDGYVRPCNNLSHSYQCYINNRLKSVTSVTFGNVLEQDLKEIWNSESYTRFRELTEKFDFPPCGDCNFADGCYELHIPVFQKDCYNHTQPCGDCPWARGILKCF